MNPATRSSGVPLPPASGAGGVHHRRYRFTGYCRNPALPQVDYPTIQITTLYPGASPEVIASSITAPLESSLARCRGWNRCGPPVPVAHRSPAL